MAGLLIGWISAIFALLAVWVVLYALVLSTLQNSHDQQVLYSQFREQLASQTAPLGGAINPGSPVALMSMPALGLRNEVVVEGTAPIQLESGPGHTRSSVLPGQPGVSVIYGRSVTFGGAFGGLASVQPGDEITMVTGQGNSRFKVIDVRHAGDPFPAPVDAGKSRLTLATAEGAGWRSGWAPTRAVYIDADLHGKAFDASSPGLADVPDAEKAMHADTKSIYTLVLWLPLIALAGGLAVWSQDRWGRLQTWIIGAPVIVACLWGASSAAMQLLPNLM